MNTLTFSDYLLRLVEKLDEERPGWRRNHVLLLDNAPSHTSETTLRLLSSLKILTCFAAPASYAALPVERLFGILKQKNFTKKVETPVMDDGRPCPPRGTTVTQLLVNAIAQELLQLDQ